MLNEGKGKKDRKEKTYKERMTYVGNSSNCSLLIANRPRQISNINQ